MTVEQDTKTADLAWLLDDLIRRVVGVDRAVVLSVDGLLIGKSTSLEPEDAEHLSAVASAFQSLARGASRQFERGAVRQTMVEMDGGFLFVMAAGAGACLSVVTNGSADLGQIAYEMNMLIKRVGALLTAAPRSVPFGDRPASPTQ